MKRLFDITLSLVVILVFSPIMLGVALSVRFSSKGSILYWSDRVGQNNQIFKMPKFRSMRTETPIVPTHLMVNPDLYLSPIGRFLRRNSLDELPQIYCVLKGDMSFVGPRPALFNQEDLIKLRSDFGVYRILPGITGWAQINGRDNMSIEEKAALDKEYLNRKSFFFDLKILYLTGIKVLLRDGVSH